MDNCEFCHLHVHTDASKDGLGTVDNLIGRAKTLGFNKLAMTDHGTLANTVSFLMTAREQGIKPIIGLEGYVAHDGAIGHITLLADGMKGWHSLLTLNNIAHASDWKAPAFTIDDLIKYNEGLVVLTGCIASPFHTLPGREAISLGHRLKGAFGHRLFAEMMFIGSLTSWTRTMDIAEAVGLRRVITNDIHYTEPGLASVHKVLTSIRSGWTYDSEGLYMKTPKELFEAARSFGFDVEDSKDMLIRAGMIGDKLGEIHLEAEPRLPYVGTTLTGFADKVRRTERAVKYLRPGNEYDERIEYEMKVVDEMDYIDYFIILDDILTNAKRLGAKVGPGRGSGAGSLILYFLGITDVDPIKHGLQFERFLNPERRGMPDVDVDIDSDKRDEVLAFASEKYGGVPISTHLKYSHKSLTRSLSRHYKMDPDRTAKASDGGPNSEAFAEMIEDNPEFIVAYEAMLGQIAHRGQHAGGVIITDKQVPIERVSKGLAAAWTEGRHNELSAVGVVKYDLLGLSVLSALRELEETTGLVPDEPVDNAPEFAIFREGRLSGIFQFSGSPGIRDLTMELEPCAFDDLVAINALYRPGAIDAGSTALYPEWKRTPRKVPAYIQPVVLETYGAIVYQEQMMKIYQLTVGGTLAEADLARRIITKAKPGDPAWEKKFNGIHKAFLDGAEARGLSPSEAEALWHELETHSRYSFNKSHSVAYAKIAWQCAWWKYNYPAHFYAAILNSDPANEQTYIFDALLDDIELVPPHVNISGIKWTASNDKLYMPLSTIRFMGEAGATGLVACREAAGGYFTTIEHFMEVVPKRLVRGQAREGLLMTNGFDGMMEHLETWEEWLKAIGTKKDLDQSMSDTKREIQYLGFQIPDAESLEVYKRAKEKGIECGIVVGIDQRRSDYGPYKVFTLAPNGGFWARNDQVEGIEKGQMIAVLKASNGKAKKIRRL